MNEKQSGKLTNCTGVREMPENQKSAMETGKASDIMAFPEDEILTGEGGLEDDWLLYLSKLLDENSHQRIPLAPTQTVPTQNLPLVPMSKKRLDRPSDITEDQPKSKYQRFTSNITNNRKEFNRYIYMIASRIVPDNVGDSMGGETDGDYYTKYVLLNLSRALECLLYPNRRGKDMFSVQYANMHNYGKFSKNMLYRTTKYELSAMMESTSLSKEIFINSLVSKLVKGPITLHYKAIERDIYQHFDQTHEFDSQEYMKKKDIAEAQEEIIGFFKNLFSNTKMTQSIIRLLKTSLLSDAVFRFQ